MELPDRAELLGAKRKMALENFYYFAKEVYGNVDMVPHVHAELCRTAMKWEKSLERDHYMQMFLLPRGSLKSSVITEAYTLWCVLRERNLRVLICNETQVKAKAFLQAIKNCIERPDFIELFGNLKTKRRWTQYEVVLAGRTWDRREASITIGAPGATKTGMHYDLCVADDLVSELTVTTEFQIAKTVDYWRMLMSLVDPGGKMILIGTRYDYDDLYGHELEAGTMDDHIWREALDDEGNLMWPERLTAGRLSSLLKKLGTYKFNCQYRNEPVSRDDATFKEEYFIRGELPDGEYNVFLMVDPACTDGITSDDSAVIVIGMGSDRKARILLAEKRKCEPSDLIDWIYSLHSYYKFERIGIETVAFQRLLVSWIAERQARGAEYLPVFQVPQSTRVSKETRIRSMEPYFQNGDMIFVGMFEALETQLLRFPRLKKDDLIDALSMFPRVCFPPGEQSKITEGRSDILRDVRNGIARHDSAGFADSARTNSSASWMKWKY